MSEVFAQRKLELARRMLASGQWGPATEALKGVLSHDPDHADAHLMLALALFEQRRIHAALHEAELGLSLAPESAFAHRVLGVVLIGMRRFADSERHLQAALAFDPTDVAAHVALANLALAQGKRAEASEWLDKALVLDPSDPDTLASLARIAIDMRDLDRAERYAREALTEHPEASSALIAMGHVLLRRGDTAGAREHVVWALQNDATDRDALGLLAQIKARESVLLGLWWRWATMMSELGDGRSVALMLGAYLAVRVAQLVLEDAGLEGLASLVQYVWLAVCVYTWIGPSVFRRMLDKELETVRLRDDY